jgi:hypothetical protein
MRHLENRSRPFLHRETALLLILHNYYPKRSDKRFTYSEGVFLGYLYYDY